MLRRVVALCGVVLLLGIGAGRNPVRADPVVNGIVIASGILVLESLFVDTPTQNEADRLSFEGGAFDPIKDVKPAGEFGMEYRSGYFLWKFKPFAGVGATTDKSFFGYAGIRLESYFGRRIVISPSFALVAYDRGDGKYLGSPVVGRSGLDFEYRFDNDMRMGFAFHHMSQGKILNSKVNPGAELVGLEFSMPVKLLQGTFP